MEVRDTFTKELLQNSGIKEGMRILDVGCGSGDLTFIVDEMLNHDVEIIGIDISGQMLQVAEGRKAGKANIEFIETDILSLPENLGLFDAIIGRRVLMYLPNVDDCIKVLRDHLKENGKMIFQESDAVSMDIKSPEFAFHNEIQRIIWKTVEAEGGNIHIGSQMYQIFKNAGMDILDIKAELILHTKETGSDLGWVAEVMTGRFKQYGLVDEDWNISEVQHKLSDELENAVAPFIRDCTYGICCLKTCV